MEDGRKWFAVVNVECVCVVHVKFIKKVKLLYMYVYMNVELFFIII